MANEDVSKLPKWARTKIRDLELTIKRLDRSLHTANVLLKKEQVESNIFIYAPIDLTFEKFYIERNSTACFVFENNRKIQVKILDRYGQEVVEIHGDDALIIKPIASNSIQIQLEK